MKIEDVKRAKAEAKKLIKYMDLLLSCVFIKNGYVYSDSSPAESGLVRAQSLILSRALADMRNPLTQRAERMRNIKEK